MISYNHPDGDSCYVEMHLKISTTNVSPWDPYKNFGYVEIFMGENTSAPVAGNSDFSITFFDDAKENVLSIYDDHV